MTVSDVYDAAMLAGFGLVGYHVHGALGAGLGLWAGIIFALFVSLRRGGHL
jgi:hypothetical protein